MAGELVTLGERLLELTDAAQRPAVEVLLDRARELRLRVLVAGEAKRGKSTLLNRLLDRELLPTGMLPVTAVSTAVRYGERDGLRVIYRDGRVEGHSLAALPGFVSEQENPGNRLGVASVEAVLAGGRLAGHPVELVDTPGTGSVFEHNTAAARDAYAGLDAVIMVVTATPPMNAAERALLTEVSARAVHTFVVLNKSDQLNGAELDETLRFTESICRAAGVSTGSIYPMSARDADAGFEQFRATFETYLAERADEDSERALRGHLLRAAQGIRDEVALELRAVQLARGESRSRLAAFADHLAALADQAAELADRCQVTERRLGRELDQQSGELRTEVSARCLELARAELHSAGDRSAVEVERIGRQAVEQLATCAVLDWREARAHELQRRVAELVAAVERERAGHLDSLREAASADLGVVLTAGVQPLPLEPSRAIWLDFTPPPSVQPPGAELLRRHGPGATRRARQRVLAGIAETTDRQVGRARADLQARLGETIRRVVAALRTEHAEMLARLQQALARAALAAADASERADQDLGQLHKRMTRLDDVVAALQR